MRKMAWALILSLLMQLVTPMTVRAAETGMDDTIAAMKFAEEDGQEETELSQNEWTMEKDENQEDVTGSEAREEDVPLEVGEYVARIDVMVDDSASVIDTENAIEIEGFIREKYYRQENGYALFIGAVMPKWDIGITQLADVAYQLDGSMTVLGTVSSDKFAYYKPTWSDRYGGCLTLLLDSKIANVPEGVHSLTVYFTVGGNRYKIAGRTEFVDELSKMQRAIDKSEETKYFSAKAGAIVRSLHFSCYGFPRNDKLNRLQLVPSGTYSVVASVEAISTSSGWDGNDRNTMVYTGKNGLLYSLESSIIPKEYFLYGDFNKIELTQDIAEGYYDILLFSSSGRVVRLEKAYYASSKPIIYAIPYYYAYGTIFPDNTGNYVSLYVYGLNLNQNSVPIFYDETGSRVLAQYIKDDPMCGCESAGDIGMYYRLRKVSADLRVDKYVEGRSTISGDVIYANGDKYCSTGITVRGIFFEEYLRNGQLYDGSAGRVRLYIGEGVNCNVGDIVTYELKARNNSKNYTDTAIVQINENGKYIEFGENSTIYNFFPGLDNYTYDFKLTKGNEVLTSTRSSRGSYIHSADSLLVPAGCSWEIHAIGEVVKTLYRGTNTSSNTASVLTNEQLSKLAQMGTVRVCIYNADGTVKERKLVYFQHDDSIISFPINVENFSYWKVKVVDSKGQPVQGAEVTYRRQTKITSDKGIVYLTDYVPGSPLSISKSGYVTYTVDSFVKDPTGCTTCRLLNAGGAFEYAYMTLNGKVTDLLTKEATINTYYSTTDFSIDYKVYGLYETCELYSGKKKIAESSDGKFSNLRFKSFQVGEPVYLSVKRKQAQPDKIKIGVQVINLDPKVFEFSIGDDISVKAPDQVPIVGGKELKIDLGTLPIQRNISADDKIQIGINVTELAKKDKDWFSTLKKMNKNNFSKYLTEVYEDDKKDEIKPKFKVMGYLESPITSSDYLKGKLLVEFSVSYNRENQYSIVGVPVVVEISISGKANADGSITFTAEQGFSGGTLKVGGEIGAGLYGGVGLAKVASTGIYGEAAIGLQYDIFPVEVRGVNQFYVTGNAGVKVKILGKDVAKHVLIDGTWNIINNDTSVTTLADNPLELTGYEVNNDAVYTDIDRTYLCPDGTMPEWTPGNQNYADGSINENVLQGATCLDIIPQVIRMGDTVMLFYLTDAGTERDVADRSMLVYSVWNQVEENWSEPKAILDDQTADFAPDLYTDGTKIYAVWQNAVESLAGNLTLNEIADRLVLHTAVYDEEQDRFTSLGDIRSENGLFQQNPQIAADGDSVSVYWYENEQDNVLGLSGTNRIYQAVLQRTDIDSKVFRKYVAVEEEAETENDAVQPETEDTEPDEDITDSTDFDESDENPDSDGTEGGNSEGNGSGETKEPPAGADQETGEDEDGQEQDTTDGTISENTIPEETISENTISENTISENTISVSMYDEADEEKQPWTVIFLQEEKGSIFSADAGKSNGRIGYAYAAGKLDNMYEISEGRAMFLAQGADAVMLDKGTLGNVEFTRVYAEETLVWYSNGDICYMAENSDIVPLFGESRLPSSNYTLLSDGAGSPEVLFPVNMDGRSELYRIGCENGEFLSAIQVTDQEDYIQYVDGFINGDRTVLVYNKMKVNEALEEVHNSLCMGTLAHSYQDIVMQSAGSMIRQDTETGEDILEITARLYNNGTVRAEGLSLSLAGSDGTVLETVPVDTVLEPGETGYGTAVFSLDHITSEAEYMITVSGIAESNQDNNSSSILLGEASLQVEAELIAVADTRSVHVGIQNTGVTPCGGTVSVRDAETGVEYCSSAFEPIDAEQTAFAQVDIDKKIFKQKDTVALEVVVEPEAGEADSVSDFVTVYAPAYAVSFVSDTEEAAIYVGHGRRAEFPKNPVKEGAYFAGWYDAQDAQSGTLYTEETPITEDVTLYACFVQEESTISMESCSVSEIPAQLYTGKALKPSVTVKWGSEVLSPKKDFTVSYQNNKKQGKATVKITGKGKYSGTILRNFMIMYPIDKASVKAIPAVNFNGEKHVPDVTVSYNKKTLVKNRDYTAVYTNNRDAGTAGVTITGKGSYMGTKTVTFQIKGISITGMKFDKISNVIYSGKNTRPSVTIKTGAGTQLQAGADYRLIYENTVNKGTATVTVVGSGNYTGTKKLTYKVLAKPLAKEMISKVEDEVYTGNAIKPDITVADDGEKLVQGQDYTVSYSKNKAVGTAMLSVKGKGNYSGTVKIPFMIQKCSLENNAQIRVQVSDIAYTGKAVKPKVQVYEGSKKIPASGYTFSYANNIEKGNGMVTVTGKGNYTGTVTAQFRIVDSAKMISSLKVDKIVDGVYTGAAVEPNVIVTDGTYTLVKGVDYETTYRNQYNAGKATVTIKGIGSYAGSKDVIYKIKKRAIADGNALAQGFMIERLPDENYTGYALKPDVVIEDRGRTLVLGKDYKCSYRKNTKIGTASVTLTGIGNYSGKYSAISFDIVGWDYHDLQAEIEDQVYTGKALKPQVVFRHAGKDIVLKTGTAVKIRYTDNKNAGTATAVITGKGELKNIDPITVSFEIGQADIAEAVVGRIPNQTLKGVAVKPIPKVKVGKNTLKAGRDFTVSYLRNGVKGEAEVIVKGTGNYTGECRKSFIVQ